MRAIGTRFTSLVAISACLGGCGGGGGGGGSGGEPAGASRLNLALSGNPADFETAEYRRSGALEPIGASLLYAAEGTGAAVTVGIIDTGIDTSHPEFVGAIHPASRDLIRGDPLTDGSGHGTAVAGLVGARRNGAAIHGVAFDAQLLAVRADSAGGCPAACVFSQSNLAAATDYAVANGARVLNYSLGDASGLAEELRESLGDAAAADRVLVFAAGNGAAASPRQPARFATSGAARGTAIVVGAVDENEVIAAFSNRAGVAADVYLVAPGVNLRTTAAGGGTGLLSGTSAATPLVAGAAAAVLDAAPHLSASQVVDILLGSARDLGAPGTDPVYGRGMLDLAGALAPAGTLTLPRGASTGDGGASLAAASLGLGDAFGAGLAAPVSAMALDAYGRAYAVELPIAKANSGSTALPALVARQRSREPDSVALGALAVDLMHPDTPGARPLIAQGDLAGLRARWQSDGLEVRAHLGEAALTAGAAPFGLGPFERGGFGQTTSLVDLAAAAGLEIAGSLGGAWRLSFGMAGDPGGVLDDSLALDSLAHAEPADCCVTPSGRLATVGLEHGDRRAGAFRLGVGLLDEEGGPLGTTGGGALQLDGATTYFMDVAGTLAFGPRTQLFGRAELGRTETAAAGGLLSGVEDLWSTSFALGLSTTELLREADRLTFTVMQPLRVEAGAAQLDLPVARDIAGNVYRQAVDIDLAPDGREIDLELGYGLPLGGTAAGSGRLQAALLLRLAPGHDSTAEPELLLGIAYRLPF
jgi:subtilisin family serine protease